jgi:transposase-like protein
MEVYEEGKVYYSKRRIRRFICEDCNYCWEEKYGEEEDLIYDDESIQESELIEEEESMICPMCGSPHISQL